MSCTAGRCLTGTPAGPTLAQNCGGSTLMAFMTILDMFLRRQCDIDDPCDRVTPRLVSKPANAYDFIVIGGGTAGSVVASRLSENKAWKVLLVEAGEDEPNGAQIPSMLTFFGSSIDWQYKTQSEKRACLNEGGVCSWPRGKVLGGTSVINGMMYVRGNREDYDKWEALGNPGWKYEDVLPFFKYSENNLQINEVDKQYHGEGGLMQISKFPHQPAMAAEILKGAQEMGYYPVDLNGRNSSGFMVAQTLSKDGVRYSAARSFLRPARHRPNLHILVNTTAARVLINSDKKAVYGIEVIDNRTKAKRVILARKEVIVSGGAINSPQILMLSGVGSRDELERAGVKTVHHLPGVGKNLMNHVSYTVNYFLNEKDLNLLNFDSVEQYFTQRKGPLAGTGLSQVTGKIISVYAEPRVADIQFYFGGYLATCSANGLNDALESNGLRRVSISPVVLQPKSKGYLTLASNNPLDYPYIFPSYLFNDHDVKVLIDGIRFANLLSQTKPLRKLGMQLDRTPVKGCEHLKFNTNAYWKCAIRRDTAPENHQAGTCKMGPKEDPLAVVDAELKVHGIRGLRVMDTSIMPTLTSGNTMAPAIMIAEKGAAMIKNDWKPIKNDSGDGSDRKDGPQIHGGPHHHDRPPPHDWHHDYEGPPPREWHHDYDGPPPRDWHNDYDGPPPRDWHNDYDGPPPRDWHHDYEGPPPRDWHHDYDGPPPHY